MNKIIKRIALRVPTINNIYEHIKQSDAKINEYEAQVEHLQEQIQHIQVEENKLNDLIEDLSQHKLFDSVKEYHSCHFIENFHFFYHGWVREDYVSKNKCLFLCCGQSPVKDSPPPPDKWNGFGRCDKGCGERFRKNA